jgi:hypothetical protein
LRVCAEAMLIAIENAAVTAQTCAKKRQTRLLNCG